MKIVDRLIEKWARAIVSAASSGNRIPGVPEWQWGYPVPPDELELDFPNAYRLVPDVYACISLIQSTIAELPLKFYTGAGNDRTELERGRSAANGSRNVVDLFATANAQDTGYELLEQLVGSLEINGNAYLFLETLGARNIDELFVIPGHFCKPIPGPNRTVTGYMFDNGAGRKQVLNPEQIVHFKTYDPDMTGIGLSPLRVAQLQYETQRDSARWQREFYKRGGAVSQYFTLDQPMDVSVRERIQRDLEKRFAGIKNAWNALVLPKGITPVRGGLTHAEMQFVETSGLTSADIFRIFKVPPVMMGVKEGGGLSDAGATTDTELFWQNCIKPRCARLETTINERLLTPDRFGRGITCEFDYSSVIAYQEIFLHQAKAYLDATGAPIMTVAEARERLGLIGLDEPTLDELLRPGTMQTVSDANEPDPVPVIAPAVPVPQDNQAMSRSAMTPRAQLRKVSNARLAQHEREFRVAIKRLFSRQEMRVVSRLHSKMQRVRVTELEDLLLSDEVDRVTVMRLIQALIAQRASSALGELALQVAFDLHARVVEEWIKAKATRMVTQINNTTRNRLRDTLAEGVRLSEGLGELTARVREVFNDRRANASDIARTETAGAYNFASEQAWIQSGVVQGKEWLTSHDELVRDSHKRAESLGVVPIGEPFQFEGEGGAMVRLDFPGDPQGPAADVINCRCTVLPALISLGDQVAASAPSMNGHSRVTFEEFAQ